jgi:recombinational DNA repair protein (RecF pathway)
MMVSSYLICDVCGQFGPPASFLHENGLRLCRQCWYRERCETPPSSAVGAEPSANLEPEPDDPNRRQERQGLAGDRADLNPATSRN